MIHTDTGFAATLTRTCGLALATALLIGAAASGADAKGWSRSSSTVGPHGGVWSSSGNGSCTGGTCASARRVTGPYGGTATRSGSATCANGSCNGTATYTGPSGRTATRTRSFTRY